MSLTLDYKWIPQDDTTVRADHRDLPRLRVTDAQPSPAQPPACRCYADPIPLDRTPTRYPKRWSRAKRKAARAREARAVDRTIARVLGIAHKVRRSP